MAHPLTGNVDWKFWQPYLQAKATFLLLGKDGTVQTRAGTSSSTCREGVLSNMLIYLRKQVLEEVENGSSYSKKFVRKFRIRLFDEALHENLAGSNQLRIHENGLKPKGGHNGTLSKAKVEEFLQVADAVVGIPSVLLSHRRPTGDWWKTDATSCKNDEDYICWNGTDNWFLRHPALLAIATGLFRQTAMLTASGFGPQILECVSREEVEEALTTGDWRLAFGLAEKLRPWIEVPVGHEGGSVVNYPFPIGQWKRFDRLQRAQRRHNYKEVFGGSMYDSWGLNKEGNGGHWSGTLAYWGNPGDESEAYDTLMKLGEPRRRAKGAKRT